MPPTKSIRKTAEPTAGLCIWYIVESIHLFLGIIGCLFYPEIIQETYLLSPLKESDELTEMTHLLGTFYVLIFVLCLTGCLKWKKETKYQAEIRSTAMSSFYGSLFLLDIYRAWNQLDDFNLNHYLDVCIHLVAGLIWTYWLYRVTRPERVLVKKKR